MRTLGFVPHIFCAGYDRFPFAATGATTYPYPGGTVAYYHPQDSCINSSLYPDLHSTMDIRGYMARYECATGANLGPLGTPIYHCSCNGLHRQHLLAPRATSSTQLSSLPYESKRMPLLGTRVESGVGAESIVTLRTKAKEYQLESLKIKSEFESR